MLFLAKVQSQYKKLEAIGSGSDMTQLKDKMNNNVSNNRNNYLWLIKTTTEKATTLRKYVYAQKNPTKYFTEWILN